MRVYKANELHVSAPDQIGLLAKVSVRCRDAGIDILGVTAYRRDNLAWFVLHTTNPVKAAEVLADMNVIWQEVLVLECEPGIGVLAKIAEKISAAGTNILYCYGSVGNGDMTRLFIDTTHNDRALEALSR